MAMVGESVAGLPRNSSGPASQTAHLVLDVRWSFQRIVGHPVAVQLLAVLYQEGSAGCHR